MKYFTIGELLYSDTALEKKINNLKTTPEIEDNLRALIENVLEPARVRLGVPIIVRSGYRCAELNKAVGGVANSQHTKGQAADLVCTKLADKRRLFEILRTMDVDQLLYERDSKGTTWIHVSYAGTKNRHDIRDNYKA